MSDTQDYWSELYHTRTESAWECINQCATFETGTECQAAVWVNQGFDGDCYFSSDADRSRGPFPGNIIAKGAERLDGTSCISTTTPTCPGADGTFYRDFNGVSYKILCDRAYQAYFEDDLGPFPGVTSYTECIAACDNNNDCKGITWNYGGSPASPECRGKWEMFDEVLSPVLNLGHNADSAFVASDMLNQ